MAQQALKLLGNASATYLNLLLQWYQSKLKDNFFIIPIAKQFHNLLLFKANAESFQFLCLHFRLCTAPRVFTKTLKPIVELLRHKASNVLGRHVTDGQFEANHLRAHLHNPVSSGEPGIWHQEQKICANSLTTNWVSWSQYMVLKLRSERSVMPSVVLGWLHLACPGTEIVIEFWCLGWQEGAVFWLCLLLTPDIPQAILGSQLPGLPITSQAVYTGSGRPSYNGGNNTSLPGMRKALFPQP